MTAIQERLLQLLDYFHNLCENAGLTYYVIGGTALGAARHKGFIPWDDDIDVGMPRKDYEKLKIVSKDQNSRFIFEFPGTSEDYVYPLMKMYDTSTTLIENTRFKTKRGIFIDIFPLDGVGNTMEESIVNFYKVYRIYRLLNAEVCSLRKGRDWYKNMVVLGMQILPRFITNPQSLIRKIDRGSKKISFYESKYVANFVGDGGKREIIERSLFGVPKEYQFEKMKVFGPEKMDEFLTCIYGNWRELPPLDKQITNHDFIKIDLDSPYIVK